MMKKLSFAQVDEETSELAPDQSKFFAEKPRLSFVLDNKSKITRHQIATERSVRQQDIIDKLMADQTDELFLQKSAIGSSKIRRPKPIMDGAEFQKEV